MPLATAEDLNKHLLETKVVRVVDSDGTAFEFRIRRVPILSWDEGGSWLAELREKDGKGLAERLGKTIGSPSYETLRKVLLRGVEAPAVSDKPTEGAVCVDDLLRRDILAVGLYQEVADYSCEKLFSVKGTDGEPKAPS